MWMKNTLILIVIFPAFFCLAYLKEKSSHSPEKRLVRLSEILIERMAGKGQKVEQFPCIKHDSTLMVNARYDAPCIVLGPVQRAFSTTDDSLSIIYHEYQHHLMAMNERYPVQYDTDGNVLQWDTGDTYLYYLSEIEIKIQLQYFEDSVLARWTDGSLMPDSVRQKHLETMRRDLARPQKMAFIYAPSNLAREELVAYRQQLKGERIGLYTLSHTAKTSINIRIEQLRGTLKRRIKYERTHDLRADGSRKP